MSFWTDADEEHQRIAEMFYQNIEYEHPNRLSGRSARGVNWCNCSWCATRIKYPSYTGPRVTSL